jgi:hypothetical protein
MHDSTEEGKMDDVRPISPPRLFWSHLEFQRHACTISLSFSTSHRLALAEPPQHLDNQNGTLTTR